MSAINAFLAAVLVAGALLGVVPQAHGSAYGNLTAVDARFDGQCFYPKADDDFELEEYLGRWYQIAVSRDTVSASCACVFAEYSANDNGTVNVSNQCEVGNRTIDVRGIASPVSHIYGNKGVFRVEFPGPPNNSTTSCPGPNYIVQDYNHDWAIVQTSNFTTFFLLSRQQVVSNADVDAWLKRAERLGTNLAYVEKTNQTNCQYS